MIPDLLIAGFLGLVAFLIGLLPEDPVTWPDVSGFGSTVGGFVGPLNGTLPIVEFVSMVTITVTVVLPALIVYKTVMWLWGVVPKPGGGT